MRCASSSDVLTLTNSRAFLKERPFQGLSFSTRMVPTSAAFHFPLRTRQSLRHLYCKIRLPCRVPESFWDSLNPTSLTESGLDHLVAGNSSGLRGCSRVDPSALACALKVTDRGIKVQTSDDDGGTSHVAHRSTERPLHLDHADLDLETKGL